MTLDTQAREHEAKLLLAKAISEQYDTPIAAVLLDLDNDDERAQWQDAALAAISAALSRSPLSREDHPVFAFLLGEGALEGQWFGEDLPFEGRPEQSRFWWRCHLVTALSAPPPAEGMEERAVVREADALRKRLLDKTAIETVGYRTAVEPFVYRLLSAIAPAAGVAEEDYHSGQGIVEEDSRPVCPHDNCHRRAPCEGRAALNCHYFDRAEEGAEK